MEECHIHDSSVPQVHFYPVRLGGRYTACVVEDRGRRRRSATQQLVRFTNTHPMLVLGIGLLFMALVTIAGMVAWDMGRDCVRWSAELRRNEYGFLKPRRVCLESRSGSEDASGDRTVVPSQR
jgi:hypothetical protein